MEVMRCMAKREHMESMKIQLPVGEMNLYRELATENQVSVASIVRALLNGRLQKYLGNVRFVDPKQGKEIKQLLMNVGTEMEKTRLEINRIGVNVNQLARVAWQDEVPDYYLFELETRKLKNIMRDYETIKCEMSDALCRIHE